MQTTPEQLPVVEVHNAWTIYGMNPNGREARQPIAMHGRPQDWGDKKRWSYHIMAFEWVHDGTRYRNNLHGWTDLKRKPYQYPQLFASLVIQILQPGTDPRLCGRSHLDTDDEWLDAWGEQPPYIDDDQDADLAWLDELGT